MSKLYNKYVELKCENPYTLLLFKTGVFYILLDEDARKFNELFKLKLVNFNNEIIKCGFPINQIGKYANCLSEKNIEFQIVENDYSVIQDRNGFLTNEINSYVIKELLSIDLENTSPYQALNILFKLKESLKGDLNESNK